jgi:Peptidase M50B-like
MQGSGFKDLYKPEKPKGAVDTNFLLNIGISAAAVALLWWTPLLFPFRIFVTIVHELGHAFTAWATGGRVSTIEINFNASGLAWVGGGFTLLIAAAGYLSSTLIGGLMLLFAKREKGRREVLWGIVAILALGTALLVRDLESLALIGIVGAVYGLSAWKAPDVLVSFLLYTTALLSCFYALSDLITLFNINTSGRQVHNDAVLLQNATGIPAIVWTILWGLVGAVIVIQFFRMALRPNVKDTSPKIKTSMDKWF